MQGCFLFLVKRLRAIERYAFSDTAVALETEAKNCNQNQGKYNRETKIFISSTKEFVASNAGSAS